MLYLAKCRECAFLTAEKEALPFKQAMASHLADSHEISYDFCCTTRISDFADSFVISRFKDASAEAGILLAMTTKRFWMVQRKQIPIFV